MKNLQNDVITETKENPVTGETENQYDSETIFNLSSDNESLNENVASTNKRLAEAHDDFFGSVFPTKKIKQEMLDASEIETLKRGPRISKIRAVSSLSTIYSTMGTEK